MKRLIVAAFIFVSTFSTNVLAEIKMGVILGFTGPIESLTPAMAASAELAFKEASDSGSLLGGKKISVIRADSTCIDSAAAASAEKYIKNEIDGVDLLPYINGEKKGLPHEYLFWQNPDKDIDVIRDERYKYIRVKEEEFIFDLLNDISEENNIISTSQNIYNRLKSKFKEWEEDMIDPVFMDLRMGKEYDNLNPDRWYISNQEKQ